MPVDALRIRQADPAIDYDRIAEIRSLCSNHSSIAAELRRSDEERSKAGFFQRLVGEVEDDIVATGAVVHMIWHPTGTFFVTSQVAPSHRRNGFGAAMLKAVEVVAAEAGAACLDSQTLDRDRSGLDFAERHGYELAARSFESVLDLALFEQPPIDLACRHPGLGFFSFAETPMDETARRRLWDLNVQTSRDEPHNDPNHVPSFEEFSAGVIDAYWFDPAGQIIAADGDHWIGMSAVGLFESQGGYNLFTGVRREYRGQGLAKTLKLLSTAYAKAVGARTLRTNNDSRNGAMLAINDALGYVRQPGWYQVRKTL